MKKILVTLAIFGAALWSCNRSDMENVDNPEKEIGSNYLSVSIVSTVETGTRADDGDGEYQYGDAAENAVKNVRFYFFDANGDAQAVKRNSTNTGWDAYYDVTKDEISTSAGTNENVEKIIDAILVLESPNGDQVPASLVAIVNYNEKAFGGRALEAGTITELLANVGKYTESKDNEGYSYKDDGFFMSSTVYRPATGSTVVEHKLKVENFYRNPEDAKANPVEIYVERAVAKVSLDTKIADAITATGEEAPNAKGGMFFPVYETVTGQDPVHLEIDGTKIYTEFLGWNVTQTADKSYAVKNLDPAWTIESSRDNDMPFAYWSSIDYHRSFWALNPSGIEWQYTDFSGDSNGEFPAGNAVSGIVDGTVNYTYVHENAPQDAEGKRTEVIVAARLVDQNGNKILLADFNGFKFIGENYKDEVLKAVANMINVWKKEDVPGGGTKYSSIEEDLELKTARELGIYDENDPDKQVGSYYVYAQLKKDAENNVYVDRDDASGQEVDNLNAKLLALPYIKVWTDGDTYYFVEIKHLNNQEWDAENDTAESYPVGKYGVVRNHWYQFEITNVFGLGTPVFDPSEKIIPEDPNQHESYLAAKININSWRLVKQSTTLGQR